MKNRLLYSLVGMMVISLVGIIVLQSIWVSKAIEDQEKEFGLLVNTALNDVNASIDENEALFFLEDGLAGLGDSLRVDHFIERTNGTRIDSEGSRIKISYKHSERHTDQEDFPSEEIERALREIRVEVEELESRTDSITVIMENAENKFHNITTVVRRFVMDHDFSRNLSDRISLSELDFLVKEKLSMQGVDAELELAVLRIPTRELVEDFATEKYQEEDTELTFKKKLFPNDRSERGRGFELAVQFNGTNGFVWSGIQSMVFLCILFTLLILTCFAYSLHLIFKQKRMSQVKNDFINNMTHELKTPLASISLAASSIEHPTVIGQPSEIQRFVKIIQSEERRMNEHVERVLDIAALDHQELRMNLEELDLLELVRNAMEHVQLSVSSSNGSVVLKTNLEIALINADKFHFLNALINVLDNSAKYRKDPLEIVVTVEAIQGNYAISISDNGIGMKKAAVKRAFDKFYREETGNIHTRKGFGLGLSYVKSIVSEHSGSVELSSELGRGTTVVINLPKR